MTCCFYHTNRTAPSLASSRCQPNVTSPAVAAVAHVRGTWPRHRPRLQPCRAVDVAAALVMGFLPWRGCSQGGFYGTGIEGVHGEDCQAIYQPAAAAEARFAAAQRRPQHAAAEAEAAAQAAPGLAAGEGPKTVPAVSSTGGPTAAAVASSRTANVTPTPLNTNSGSSRDSSRPSGSASWVDGSSSTPTTTGSSSSRSDDVANAVGAFSHQHARATSGAAAEQLQQVPESVKDLVREILRDDNRARTKQLVDDAWQTLE